MNPFHLVAYQKAEAATQVNVDMLAVTDPIFSIRNNHFIFSEAYMFLFLYANSVHLTNLRSNVPTWNAIGRHRVWPFDVAGNDGRANNYPRVQDLTNYPMPIPVNEEIAFEQSTSSSGASSLTATVGAILAVPGQWSRNFTPGSPRLMIQGAITCSTVAGSWSGPQTITFTDNFRGGWYAVNGAYVVNNDTAHPALLFRLFFPRAPTVNGRVFRPGSYVTDTIGNMEVPNMNDNLGEWGRFNSFEPPQMEVLTNAAQTTQTWTVRLDVTYLGTSPSYEQPQAITIPVG